MTAPSSNPSLTTSSFDPDDMVNFVLGHRRESPHRNLSVPVAGRSRFSLPVSRKSSFQPTLQLPLPDPSDNLSQYFKLDELERVAIARRRILWDLLVDLAAKGGVDGIQRDQMKKLFDQMYTRSMNFELIADYPESGIQVPLQLVHCSRYAIDDHLATTFCQDLPLDELLDYLNNLLVTRHTLDTPGLLPCLIYFQQIYTLPYTTQLPGEGDRTREDFSRPCDFGLLYGMLRRMWLHAAGDFSGVVKSMQDRENRNLARRLLSESEEGHIREVQYPPRRLWDLYSNRVIPYWAVEGLIEPREIWAVSHSWAAPTDIQYVLTEINGLQWPVPIPKDVSLDRVRIELLNLGAEYVWIDILCLRQRCPDDGEEAAVFLTKWGLTEDSRSSSIGRETLTKMEQERLLHWKLDVPTIGYVYQLDILKTVVVYFNGLGRPFVSSPSLLEDQRHWFNRVWTLQEATINWVPGGLTPFSFESPHCPLVISSDLYERYRHEFLNFTHHLLSPSLFDILRNVQRRGYSKIFDQVGSIVYVLQPTFLPTYVAQKSNSTDVDDLEAYWERVIETMNPTHRTDLLLFYPFPGHAPGPTWRPSWTELMRNEDLPSSPRLEYGYREKLVHRRQSNNSIYYHHAYAIPRCYIKFQGSQKQGVILSRAESSEGVKVIFEHNTPVAEGWYTLVSVANLEHWVVGKTQNYASIDRDFPWKITVSKVSIVTMDSIERKKLGSLQGSRMQVSYV
jgi:hypothetical protein